MSFALSNHYPISNQPDIHRESCNKNVSAKPEDPIPNRSKTITVPDFFENRHSTPISPGVTSNPPDTPANPNGAQSASETGITVSNQIKAGITITTADGDTVTLNASMLFEAGFTEYSQSGEMNKSPYDISAVGASLRYSSEFSLSVDGQLDNEELRDIAKAVRQVNKIMRRLLSGDMEHALKRASKLHRLDSISGIEALLEFDKTVSVTQQAAYTASPSEAAPEIEEPATAPVESPTDSAEEPVSEKAA